MRPPAGDAVDAVDAVEPVELSDGELLDQARRGDSEAFGVLFTRYRDVAAKVARRAGTRPSDVDDVVADAWARVFRAMRGGNGPTENFPGYLATAIRRVSWAHNEHHAQNIPTDDQSTLDGVWIDELPDALQDTDMGRAFSRLPAPWREVIWRVEVDGEKVAAIAAERRKSPNSVSAVASRARRRLRAELEALEAVEGLSA
ncbi:MAG TPA: sigma-70 family RNA polymerase sigma factor [Nocardioides sp.]|nr:sigma-70 family RNA polymerase sigma factor [Nocardioides sp.]